jgi:hypothetical protein
MNAKEMFEALGYTFKTVIDKWKNTIIVYENYEMSIEFDTHYNTCYLVHATSYDEQEVAIAIGGIGGKFILAITQQMKELGWIK